MDPKEDAKIVPDDEEMKEIEEAEEDMALLESIFSSGK